VEKWLGEKYGGVEGYLAEAGVSSAAQEAVKRSLCPAASEKLVEY
jgi:hypothetical protein